MPLNQHDLVFLGGRIVEGAARGYRRGGVWAGCKYLALGAICVGLAACAQIPEWSAQRNIVPQYDYMLVGYGSGETVRDAQANARDDISRALLTSIQSRVECKESLNQEVRRQGNRVSDQQSSSRRRCEEDIDASVSSNLAGAKVIKQERSNDQVYVAVEYDSRVIHKKIVDYMRRLGTSDGGREVFCVPGNSLLATTDFHKSLRQEMGPGSCVPFWQLNYDNLWTVSIQGGGQFAPNHKKIQQFFPELRSQSVELVLPQNREIVAGEKYSVTAKSLDAGYLTLLQANELGQVQRLSENVPVEPDTRVRFPERGVAFLSTVEDGYRYASELFVALLCPRQIEFDYPDIAMGSYPTEYNYGRLLRWLSGDDLSDSGCDLTLSRLRISQKSS